MLFRRTAVALALVAAAFGCGEAVAQDFPSRPVRLVIPYPAGGTTDIIARALQEPLRAALGQPIVVENKGGGAGAIALREVANAAPDGHTLVISNNGPSTLLPLIRTDIGYGPTGSLAPVARLTTAPLILMVPTTLPATDLRQFIGHARAHRDRLSYATAGVGSLGHVATLLMNQQADFQAVHVPYRGLAPMALAVASGEVQFVLSTWSSALQAQVEAGKLRRLGVSTPRASELVPGVPPIAEVLPGFSVEVWFGVFAPGGTPPAVISRLNTAVRDALALPAVKQTLRDAGMLAQASTPEEFAQLLETEAALWRGVVTTANIKPE
jgi:tripartite-type tricarboxylate transporter receptor subunit TctC